MGLKIFLYLIKKKRIENIFFLFEFNEFGGPLFWVTLDICVIMDETISNCSRVHWNAYDVAWG